MTREKFIYYPSDQRKSKIKTLLLDANMTALLDTIARNGLPNSEQSKVTKNRLNDLISKLDDKLLVMPGLGAAESVLRRNDRLAEKQNYYRRSENSIRLLTSERSLLEAWIKGDGFQTGVLSQTKEEDSDQIPDALFSLVRESRIRPSYAIMLKAYKLYLEQKKTGRNPVSSFNELASFAEELYGRGSRELMFSMLLLLGNNNGQRVALDIMKLQKQEKSCCKILNCLWNTCFDLTYSRAADQPLLPELNRTIPQPAVFVTDDARLGDFLKRLHPAGSIARPIGAGITVGFFDYANLIPEERFIKAKKIINASTKSTLNDRTDVQLLQRVRSQKAKKYIGVLENWFENEYAY